MSRYDIEKSTRACLVGAIVESKGNISKTAELTGLTRATCYRLIKKHGIDLKGYRLSAGVKLGRSN